MVRERSVALGIILSLLTCGLYDLYWIVCIANDSNELTRKGDMSGGVVLLLGIITCGLFWLYWFYKVGADLSKVDGKDGDLGIVCLLLGIFGLGIISIALLQNRLNAFSGNKAF